MKKIVLNYLMIVALAVGASLMSCNKDDDVIDDDISGITMTTAKDNVTLSIYALGTITLDWGDETAIDSLFVWGEKTFSHSYTNSYLHKITLTGDEIITLDCYGNQLTNLNTSAFSMLNSLYCNDNQLTSLDLSDNAELKRLNCANNQIMELDLNNNTKLESLVCSYNELESLNTSKCTELYWLVCYGQQYGIKLTSLDVRNNTKLRRLFCSNHLITSLDVSQHTQLTELDCSANKITSLDIRQSTLLTELNCNYNQLTSLDLSNNTGLMRLYCASNQLTSLDASKNIALLNLYCRDNQLTSSALDALFETLHNNDVIDPFKNGEISEKIIIIESNPGASACNRNIATEKGWTFLH